MPATGSHCCLQTSVQSRCDRLALLHCGACCQDRARDPSSQAGDRLAPLSANVRPIQVRRARTAALRIRRSCAHAPTSCSLCPVWRSLAFRCTYAEPWPETSATLPALRLVAIATIRDGQATATSAARVPLRATACASRSLSWRCEAAIAPHSSTGERYAAHSSQAALIAEMRDIQTSHAVKVFEGVSDVTALFFFCCSVCRLKRGHLTVRA